MAKLQGRLNHRRALNEKTAGLYRDSDGLYFQVTDTGVRSWILRYHLNGRSRYMGLGPFPAVTISDARLRAAQIRNEIRLTGDDPIETRRAQLLQRKLDSAKSISFKTCAEEFIQTNQVGWSNEKHSWQWTRTLELYAYPVIGHIPVSEVDTGLIIKILQPIWASITETANRVRGRIERILAYAATSGLRKDDNPARWKGHLENLLPKPSSIRTVQNQPALSWREIPTFFKALTEIDTTVARALQFTILTVARTNEAIGSEWQEFNIENALWTVPAKRIKARKEHRVPLSRHPLLILAQMQKLSGMETSFVFPGRRSGEALSDMSLLMTLRRMGYGNITTHGFRSTFRDWVAETTDTTREVAEMALAHVVESKVEAAYRRGDLFEKRRKLMMLWDRYCHSQIKE